jgi:protein phosphatase
VRTGRTAALSDTGRRRLRNEDAFVCDPPFFAIADGMGGAQAGELASRLAATALAERELGMRGEEAVASLVQAANERVYQRALEDPAAAGMGTTVTVALVDPSAGSVTIGHVGDSRAYRVRGERLEQLTADHSLVAELVRSGRLTPEQAADHPHRSVITRAVGTEPSVEVDTFTLEALAGDLYLLCSDGLTDMVGDEEILALADSAGRDPDGVARRLVDAANRAGGVDNVTVVAFELLEGDEPEAAPPVPVADGGPEPATGTSALHAPRPAGAPAEVRRRGAGKGGRALALLGVLAVVGTAVLVVWWSVVR